MVKLGANLHSVREITRPFIGNADRSSALIAREHVCEILEKLDGRGRPALLLRDLDDVVQDMGDLAQLGDAARRQDVEECREGDGDGLIVFLEPAVLLLESLDVPFLGRNDLDQGQHLFGQSIHGSVHVDRASQVFDV
jgi:hypothetical protein